MSAEDELMASEVKKDASAEDAGEASEGGYCEIDKLQEHGINQSVRIRSMAACTHELPVYHEQDIKKLKSAGLYTVSSIMIARARFARFNSISLTSHAQTLTEIKGMSEAKVEKLITSGEPRTSDKLITCLRDSSAKKIQPFEFVSGTEVQQKRKGLLKITTGCNALDEMLSACDQI